MATNLRICVYTGKAKEELNDFKALLARQEEQMGHKQFRGGGPTVIQVCRGWGGGGFRGIFLLYV